MAVDLSVKDVREALLRAAGSSAAGDGQPATLLLGRLFHEVFAELVGRDEARNGVRLLLEVGLERERWYDPLVEHTYRVLVGPRLRRHQAYLQQTSQQVLVFWEAIRNLARWLADITWTVVSARRDRLPTWEDVARLLRAEVPLSCELREPGWTDSVRLTGVADSLLLDPARSLFCAIELKLGRANPAVDLGQSALYHLIASRAARKPGGAPGSALALLHFTPVLSEVVFSAGEATGAQARLLELIGREAGVLPAAPHPETSPGAAPPTHNDRYIELGQKLARAFREYGRPIELAGPPTVGPRFLRFEARLGRGVQFSQVARLATEVRLRAGLRHEPIISKDDGRLVLDVERPDPEKVLFSSVSAELSAGDRRRGSARLPIGVDIQGRLRCADLADPMNAHLLVAGTTGSGKTEWLRMAIAGLLLGNTPETLHLVLIDPKLAAFMDLRRSPYLWSRHGLWVPGSETDVVEVLEALVTEMEARYQLFAAAGVDDIARYVERTRRPLERIVCFCDEYFALISQDRQQRKQIEAQIFLLGAKARAAGIHLVIATQQPSRQVIQGTLDANMPCRVGLMTQSAIESRMLLQVAGAERLTGFGDLLYKDVGDPVRLQAPYLPPEERARIFAAQ